MEELGRGNHIVSDISPNPVYVDCWVVCAKDTACGCDAITQGIQVGGPTGWCKRLFPGPGRSQSRDPSVVVPGLRNDIP